MKKFSLKDVKNVLKRDEMRMILGGQVSSYCQYTCRSGGGSGSSSGSTIEETVSVAESNCGAGNYTTICVG
jgi:natural product precursor